MAESGFLTEEELKRFLTAASQHTKEDEPDKRPYMVSVVLLDTGIRISELVGEKYKYYTKDNGGHVVAPSEAREANGKAKVGYAYHTNSIGGLRIQDIHLEDHIFVIREAKGKKTRVVPFSERSQEVIGEHLRATKRNWTSTGKLIDVNTETVRKWFSQISEKAGTQRVFPHLFRNTFAVRYLKSKGDIRVLQKILGHSSLDITQKYLKYSDSYTNEDYRATMQKVNNI